jgi:dolichyl-phosphate-mannose--protein O-mannosyl transferase
MYLLLEYTENNRCTLTLAGIAIGLTIATKAYFVFAIPVMIAYALYRECQRNSGSRFLIFLEFMIKLGLLPMAIYLLTYIFWFGRGYTIIEFLQFRSDAYWLFNNNFSFSHEKMLARGGKPWEWFVKPISFGHHLNSEGNLDRYTLEINNPLFRLMVLPAIGIVLYHATKQRNLTWFIAPTLFAASYLLFFLVNRQINSYSALAVLPFAYVALAHAVFLLARKYQSETEITALFLLAIFVSGCYLFPVSSGFWVPSSFYRTLLSISDLTKVF